MGVFLNLESASFSDENLPHKAGQTVAYGKGAPHPTNQCPLFGSCKHHKFTAWQVSVVMATLEMTTGVENLQEISSKKSPSLSSPSFPRTFLALPPGKVPHFYSLSRKIGFGRGPHPSLLSDSVVLALNFNSQLCWTLAIGLTHEYFFWQHSEGQDCPGQSNSLDAHWKLCGI